MTTSTDGQICYGVLFGEDHEFPWGSDEWEGNIEEWWLYEVCGYRNPFELYDERGNWLGGVKPPEEQIRKYYDLRYAFLRQRPIPVSLVNYCSGDFPMYIVAVPDSITVASRGYPRMINTQDLVITPKKETALWEFCRDHLGITEETANTEPRWWLSSYWG